MGNARSQMVCSRVCGTASVYDSRRHHLGRSVTNQNMRTVDPRLWPNKRRIKPREIFNMLILSAARCATNRHTRTFDTLTKHCARIKNLVYQISKNDKLCEKIRYKVKKEFIPCKQIIQVQYIYTSFSASILVWLHLIMHWTIGLTGYIGLSGNGLLD